FQAEDGIRDPLVTGVQTCALPISAASPSGPGISFPSFTSFSSGFRHTEPAARKFLFTRFNNRIRLTGMPGFHASLTDKEWWQVSVFPANADKLPASVQQAPATTPAASGQPTVSVKSPNSKKPRPQVLPGDKPIGRRSLPTD